MSEAENWAPKRIWLQREQGEMASHTWCEDSVGDDMIEEVGYVRADVAEALLETLQSLERRFQAGIELGLSAAEAYYSFYQEIVSEAIDKATEA